MRIRGTLAWTAMAACVWATNAAAQFPAGGTNVVASALALPVDLRFNGRMTDIVITNAGPAVTLRILVIDDDWSVGAAFNCFVTANETSLFEFRRDPYTDQATMSYECTTGNTGFPPAPSVRSDDVPLDVDQGIMFVSIESGSGGTTTHSDQIFGDATVIDFDQGIAYSFDAIPFGAAGSNNGNRLYSFDSRGEYSPFPARLATNFIAPTQSPPPYNQDEISAWLILFTLDGTIGNAPPHASLSVSFFNDDEVGRSNTYSFDGFSIVSLDAIDPRFRADQLGSAAGHLVLTPQITVHGDPSHDVQFGNGNGVRRTPVHGWLIQSAIAGSQVGGSTLYLSSDPGWGRPLARSVTSLVEEGDDIPLLNALCFTAPCVP